MCEEDGMEEWKECKLGDLCIDNKGSYGIAASAVPYSENLYTYLRITDINDDGTLNKSDLKSVADENAEQYILQPNDIVFARTGGSTGRNYFYDGSDGVFVYAGFLIKFSIDPSKVNPKYIKYFCLSQEYKNWVYSFNTGSTRGNINAQTYANMPVILPPRSQQDLLVKTLSSLDDKIELNNKINDNLEQQAQAIFKSWFVDGSEKSHTIGDYIVPKRGKNLLSKDAILGDVPVVAGGLEPATYHNSANTKPPVLTISASGANAGFVNLWNIPVWSSDSSFIDLTMTKEVYFWYVLLKLRQKEIFDSQTGSAQPHIYPQHISVLPIAELDMTKVSEFTKTVTPLFGKISENQQENRTLTTIRDTLLPKLMNGEIEVDSVQI